MILILMFSCRTSSGKSASINALLRDNVLPSLCGETTAGFITVEGTDEPNEYAEVYLDGDKKTITMEVRVLKHTIPFI